MPPTDDWRAQERPVGGVARFGEALAGMGVAIGLQALLSLTLVGGGVVYGLSPDPAKLGALIGLAACGQFVWLFPAFLLSLWFRPGFAGGLAAGAVLGSFLGLCLACLAAWP